MFWTQLNLYTSIPRLPQILNANFLSFERYIDVFYDGSLGILTVPIETTGRVKGASGEFVTAVVDNLIVKKQFTNLYDNNTTADYNWYRMIVDPVTIGRDPCTYGIDTSSWKFPYEPQGTKVIDVQKPYYKISNDYPIFLGNNNLSQVVGIYLDSSITSIDQFKIILDPCSGSYYEIDSSMAGSFFMDFICTAYDPSWGSTWETYKYGVESGGAGGGGGIVGPGTLNYLAVTKLDVVGDVSISSDLFIHGMDSLASSNIVYVQPDGKLTYSQNNFAIDSSILWKVDASLIMPRNIDHDVQLNSIQIETDAGAVSIMDMDVSLAISGTEESYAFNLNGIPFLKIYGQSNGAGDVIHPQVISEVPLVTKGTEFIGLGDPCTNGSWRFVISGGNLSIQKLVSDVWVEKTLIV